jgi:hypothetical protein
MQLSRIRCAGPGPGVAGAGRLAEEFPSRRSGPHLLTERVRVMELHHASRSHHGPLSGSGPRWVAAPHQCDRGVQPGWPRPTTIARTPTLCFRSREGGGHAVGHPVSGLFVRNRVSGRGIAEDALCDRHTQAGKTPASSRQQHPSAQPDGAANLRPDTPALFGRRRFVFS